MVRLIAETGMVVDLVELDQNGANRSAVIGSTIANLNLDPLFADRVPTTEKFLHGDL